MVPNIGGNNPNVSWEIGNMNGDFMLDINFNSNFENLDSENIIDIKMDKIQNNVFTSPHWFANLSGENIFSFIAGGNQQGSNAVHVKSQNTFGFKLAEMAGEPFIQYNDMAKYSAKPTDQFLDDFLHFLKNNHIDALYLHNVRADAHIFQYCMEAGLVIAEKSAPYLDLGKHANFDAYFKSLSKQTRYTHNRLTRKHKCEYSLYKNSEITSDIIGQVVTQKQQQLKLRGETSRLFADLSKLEQLKKFLLNPAVDFDIFISTLKVDGAMASSTVFFIHEGKLYFYILAMDDDFAKLSPGNNIVLRNIETAFDNGCQIFDFLAPSDAYKLKWARGESIAVYDILLPITPKGKLFGYFYYKTLRPLLKYIYLAVKKARILSQ